MSRMRTVAMVTGVAALGYGVLAAQDSFDIKKGIDTAVSATIEATAAASSAAYEGSKGLVQKIGSPLDVREFEKDGCLEPNMLHIDGKPAYRVAFGSDGKISSLEEYQGYKVAGDGSCNIDYGSAIAVK